MESSDQSTTVSKVARMKKPVRPDTQDLKKKTDRLTAEIERYAERIKEIKAKLDNRRRGHQVSAREREVMRSLNDSRAEFQKNLKQKQAVQAELTKVNDKRESLRAQARSVKESFKAPTADEFDAQIRKIEHRLNTEDLSPEEQEKEVQRIKQLGKSRENVKMHTQHLNDLQKGDALREELLSKTKALDEELDRLKGEEVKNRSELQRIRTEQATDSEDYDTLAQEKQDCWEVMCALRDKRTQIREEIDEKMTNFQKENAMYRDHMQQERQMRDEARRAEYEKNSAEREAKQKEYEAFQKDAKKNDDVIRCEQLLAYLSKFVQETKIQEKNAVDDKQIEAPAEGMRLIKKTDKDMEDSWLFKSNGDAKPKKSKGKKPKKPAEKPVEKRLQHPLDSLSAFHYLKIAVPNTMGEVAKTIEAVEEKKKAIEEGKVASGSGSQGKEDKEAGTQGKDAEKENGADTGNEIGEKEGTSEGGIDADKAEEEEKKDSAQEGGTEKEPKEEFPPLGGEEGEEVVEDAAEQ